MAAIDADDLIPVNSSYVLQDFSEKEADVVCRLKNRDKNVIFYILLERNPYKEARDREQREQILKEL